MTTRIAALLGDQDTGIMTQYSTQLHCPDTELNITYPIVEMPSSRARASLAGDSCSSKNQRHQIDTCHFLAWRSALKGYGKSQCLSG